MPYCTQSDILLRVEESVLIQLTDDAETGAIDSGIVDRAIADADEEIDSYPAAKYNLPFETIPNLVRRMSVAIAISNLYGRRDFDLPANRSSECDLTRKNLDKIAKGTMVLDVPEPAIDTNFGIEATTAKSDRIFSSGRASKGERGTLDNY